MGKEVQVILIPPDLASEYSKEDRFETPRSTVFMRALAVWGTWAIRLSFQVAIAFRDSHVTSGTSAGQTMLIGSLPTTSG